jgi:putative nucleotidyltransferase with HDIG domain
MTAKAPDDDVHRAEVLAAGLLSGLSVRWLHVQTVAERAAQLSPVVSPSDRALLVAGAWLHDIGYAPALAETGFHPLDGARYLTAEGFPDRLVQLVAHHTGATYEAEERGLSAELAEFEREDGPLLDALTCADLTTGPAGEAYTFDQRIDEILTRYGPDSPVHRAITRARPYLAGCVERTMARLDGQPT